MLPDYADIRALTDREPDWFDGDGVPRYQPFHPRMLGVYDDMAVLTLIQCQSCREKFRVGEAWNVMDHVRHQMMFRGSDSTDNWDDRPTLADVVKRYHYGDPPRHGGCAGETMNCEDIAIIEAWEKNRPGYEWVRRPEHEGLIEDTDKETTE